MNSVQAKKPKVPKIPDIVIAVDLGGSLTKISAVTKEGKYCLLAPLSEVAAIPPDILQDVQANHWGEATPESCIWVATKDGRGYALGSYAREQFMASANLKLSKLETAVPKILGGLWVLKEKLNLPNKFQAVIGVLLPDAECSNADKEELIELLTPHLKSFITPAGRMSVKLTNKVVVKPEGAGVLSAYKAGCTPQDYQSSKIGFLGIGFRNSNLLVSKNGTTGASDRYTSSLGFYSLVKSAKEEIGSAVDEVQLASVIGEAGLDINEIYLERFLKTIRREKRLKNVMEAIARAQKMYLCQLDAWLEKCEVRELDRILFYGGTVEYFRPRLADKFANLDELVWHSNFSIPNDLITSVVAERDQSALHVRFMDSWCYLHYLCGPQAEYQPWTLSNLVKEKELVGVGG